MRVNPQSSSGPNLWKGLVAGALGGLTGSFVMSEFYSLLLRAKSNLEPLKNSEPLKEDSTVIAASAISQTLFHHELTPDQKTMAGPAVHYLFGATTAATYGLLVEFWDAARLGWGLPFGAAVWLGAHVITVPALGLSEPITRSAAGTEAVEGAAHLVYGAVVEVVRRSLREILASRAGS
jgi:putative membrane protein